MGGLLLPGDSDFNKAHINSDVNLAPGSLHHTIGPNGAAAFKHKHVELDITNLITDLAGKSATGHGHVESDVTNLVADLADIATELASRIKNPITNNVLMTANTTTATTSAAGIITITHGLGVAPLVCVAVINGAATPRYCSISNKLSTTFDVTVWGKAGIFGAADDAVSRTVNWIAIGV